MARTSISDFEALGLMALNERDIRVTNTIKSVSSTDKSSSITMEVDEKTAQEVANCLIKNNAKPRLGVIMYVINLDEFDKIKARKRTIKSK